MDPFKTMIIMYVLTVIFVVYNILTYSSQMNVFVSILFSVLIVFPLLAILAYYKNIVRGEIGGR